MINTAHFYDFTVDHYRVILQRALERFEFCFYDEIENRDSFLLWRHDLDFSIQRAFRLAQVEQALGVRATYFVHLHSEYYNFQEKNMAAMIAGISEMGHSIGLHFDTHFYDIRDEAQLEDKLLFEAGVLEKIFGTKINVFSFHVTNPFTMNCKNWQYAGLINTYASTFQDNVEYCSDSNGYWRFNRLFDVVDKTESKKLQVLTHPEWWQETAMSPWQRIVRCIDGRAAANKTFYKDNLKRWGMKNLDWQGEVG